MVGRQPINILAEVNGSVVESVEDCRAGQLTRVFFLWRGKKNKGKWKGPPSANYSRPHQDPHSPRTGLVPAGFF